MIDPTDSDDTERVSERLDRLERAIAELTEAVLLVTRNGPAHFEEARTHAHRAKDLLPRDR